MAERKKLVSEITSMDVDFAQWYTDIVKKAEMADYSSVKGCIIMRPYAQALWENIQHTLDGMFKETGHENVAMPIFIPESLLQKEADHVEGFAPECAWVTHGGNDKLEERLCVRPTSETLFCEHYAKDRSLLARSAEAVQPVVLGCPLGKRPPVRSCAAVSSGGRRVTPFMLPPRRLWKRLCAC